MKFPIKKSRSFFRKIGSCASYASYASYAYCASENRRMFGIKTMGKNCFHRLQTPSTAHGAVPLPRGGRSGASRFLSKPRIQPRVQGLNPGRFNGGYGVPRGFKGEKSKFPPNPLGLAERVHRPQTMIPPRSPTPHSSCEFGFFFICFICPKHMMFSSKTIRCPSGECRDHRHVFFIESTYFEIRKRMKFQKNADL